MIQVSGLYVYPVKSCRGISLAETEIGLRGFLHDREFLVVDETDTFITQRNAAELATVEIALDEVGLVLKAPNAGELHLSFREIDERCGAFGMRRVTIFRDSVMADDVGDEASEWFGVVLQRKCRLVRVGKSYSRKVPQERIPQAYRVAQGPEVSFTDAFPTLLISEESLADLNTRLAKPLPMNRFRPNIVVHGCSPYDENTWKCVQAGTITFNCAATCQRCVIATIDQRSGRNDGAEPLRTLATYRRSADGKGVVFGAYLIHSGGGTLRVGERLIAESTST